MSRHSKADFKMLKGSTIRLQVVDFGEDVELREKNSVLILKQSINKGFLING